MNVLLHTDKNFAAQLKELTAPSSLFDPTIEQQTRAIVEAVQHRGDEAILEYTERFQGARLAPEQMAITQSEKLAASLHADKPLRAALADASKNVENFAKNPSAKTGPCAIRTAQPWGKNSTLSLA